MSKDDENTPYCPCCLKEGKGWRRTYRRGYGNVFCPLHGEMNAASAEKEAKCFLSQPKRVGASAGPIGRGTSSI